MLAASENLLSYYKLGSVNRVILVYVFGAVWMIANVRSLRYLLGWLIAGTRGGVTRAQIIEALTESPQNANQLANLLKKDYRTIRHHLEVLQKNKLITSVGDKYGITYFLSPQLEENYVLFEEITNKIWKKRKKEEK